MYRPKASQGVKHHWNFWCGCEMVKWKVFFSIFCFVSWVIFLLSCKCTDKSLEYMNTYWNYPKILQYIQKEDWKQSSRLTFWHTSPKSVFLTFFFTYNWLVTPDFEHVEEISQARQLFYWPVPSGLWLNSKTVFVYCLYWKCNLGTFCMVSSEYFSKIWTFLFFI